MNVIQAIREGDEIVFREVFNEYHEKLYFFIFNKVKSRYLAEETVQLTFIKLWQSRANISENYKISTQIFRIASTVLIDLLRKESRMKKRRAEDNVYFLAESWSSQDDIEARELHDRLKEAARILPPVRRKVFELSRLKGMSYKEIAAYLSISEKTVENHISRSLKQIRAYLAILISVLSIFTVYLF